MIQQVNITLLNSGDLYAKAKNRPLRKLPSGHAGVVWQGQVYPLRSDFTVEITDQPHEKADCTDFFRQDEEVSFAASPLSDSPWVFERTSRGAYLAFNRRTTAPEMIAESLSAAGVTKDPGFYESFRPAANGHQYDYYIRLKDDFDETAGARQIQSVFDEVTHSLQSEHELSIETSSEDGTADGLKGSIDTLRRQLSESENLSATLRNRIEELENENQELSKKIRGILNSAEESKFDELADLESELYLQYQSKLNELSEKLRQAEFKNEKLIEELRANSKENSPVTIIKSTTTSKKIKRLFHEFFENAFPKINLGDEDRRSLLSEYEDISHVIEIIRIIQNGGAPAHQKSWKGINGVWEIPKVRTGAPGKENMGRLYYQVQSEEVIEVAVHIKTDEKSQRKFVSQRFS